MSCFKEDKRWRWNESQKTVEYFKCKLKEYVEKNGLNVSELVCQNNQNFTLTSNDKLL